MVSTSARHALVRSYITIRWENLALNIRDYELVGRGR